MRDSLGSSRHKGAIVRALFAAVLLLVAAACQRAPGSQRLSERPLSSSADSLSRIYLAYNRHQISAEVAAKAIVGEQERTHASWGAEMDAPLRAAIEREMQARGHIHPDTGSKR